MPVPSDPPTVSAQGIIRDSNDLDNAFTATFSGVDLTVDQEGVVFELDGTTTYRVWAYARTSATGDHHAFCEADLTLITGTSANVEASASGQTNTDTVSVSSPGSNWENTPSASASDQEGGSWKFTASLSNVNGLYMVVMPLTEQPGSGDWASYVATGGWAEVSGGLADVTVTASSGDMYAVFLVDGDPGGTTTPVIRSPAQLITL